MESLETIRKHLHRFPELSGQEYETQRFLRKHLEGLQHQYFSEVGTTGLLLGFYSGQVGPSILLRADIDALPIKEINTFEHRSLKKMNHISVGTMGMPLLW